MNPPKYLRNRLRKDQRAPTLLSSSLYRSVSSHAFHGRWSVPPSIGAIILAPDSAPDAPMEVGGMVRNPRLVDLDRPSLHRRFRDNSTQLGGLWGYSVLDHRREGSTIPTSNGGHENKSGVPGPRPANRPVLQSVRMVSDDRQLQGEM